MIRARFVVLAVVVAAATGCSSKGSDNVDASLTAQRAQQRIYQLMTDTLRGLPPGVSLSKTPASDQLGTRNLTHPITVPCWEGNTQTEGPHYLRVGYWLVGVPPGGTRDYFDRIKQVWQNHDWKPVDSTQWVLVVKTEDGYGLQLQDADKGDGSLSLTGMSPCVPQSALEPIDPDPTEIKAG